MTGMEIFQMTTEWANISWQLSQLYKINKGTWLNWQAAWSRVGNTRRSLGIQTYVTICSIMFQKSDISISDLKLATLPRVYCDGNVKNTGCSPGFDQGEMLYQLAFTTCTCICKLWRLEPSLHSNVVSVKSILGKWSICISCFLSQQLLHSMQKLFGFLVQYMEGLL